MVNMMDTLTLTRDTLNCVAVAYQLSRRANSEHRHYSPLACHRLVAILKET